MSIEVLLNVGKLDASLALLTTQNHHVIEFPTVLLPDNIKAGSIVKIQVTKDFKQEQLERERFAKIQDKILEKYGTMEPKAPQLRLVNVTQTSCVLEWDPLDVGSAQLTSLILYKQHARALNIPNPLNSTSTKVSGLSIDTEYEFQLKLSTTSGKLWSNTLKVRTHKMTDMSGITVCLGPLDKNGGITREQVVASLKAIGAKSPQKKVSLDTTHFVCGEEVEEDNRELMRAKNGNIPIVRPEWIRACELEKRIVGVRGFYLDVDRSTLESYRFTSSDEPRSTDAPQDFPTGGQETWPEGVGPSVSDSISAHRTSDEPARNELSDDTVASIAPEETNPELEVPQQPEPDIVETIEGPASEKPDRVEDNVAEEPMENVVEEPIDSPSKGTEIRTHHADDNRNETAVLDGDKQDDYSGVNTVDSAVKDDSVPAETQNLQNKDGEATEPVVANAAPPAEFGSPVEAAPPAESTPPKAKTSLESPVVLTDAPAQGTAKNSPPGKDDVPAKDPLEPSLPIETANLAGSEPELNTGEPAASTDEVPPAASNDGPDAAPSAVDEAAGPSNGPSVPGTPIASVNKNSSAVNVSPAKSTGSPQKGKNKKKKGKRA